MQLPHVVRRAVATIESAPTVGLWAGLALVAVGFAVIAITWVRVGLTVDVSQQLPLIISGGFGGLGLDGVGLGLVVVASRSTGRAAVNGELRELRDVLSRLRVELESRR